MRLIEFECRDAETGKVLYKALFNFLKYPILLVDAFKRIDKEYNQNCVYFIRTRFA